LTVNVTIERTCLLDVEVLVLLERDGARLRERLAPGRDS